MIERAMMERAFYGPHFPARNSNFEGVSEEKRALGDVASKTATKSKVRWKEKLNPLSRKETFSASVAHTFYLEKFEAAEQSLANFSTRECTSKRSLRATRKALN